MKSTYNETHNFTHKLDKNNKISFLDVLIDTTANNNNFTPSLYKKTPLITTPIPLTLKMNAPSDIKKQLLIT